MTTITNKNFNKYHITIRILHWIIALLIISAIIIGLAASNMQSEQFFGISTKNLYLSHKALGFSVIPLIILRTIARLFTKAPSYPSHMNKIEQLLAHLTHLALYGLMWIVPISGYVMSKHKFKWLGMQISPLASSNNIKTISHDLHVFLAFSLIFLITLHILAAMKHQFVNKDNIIKRIT